MSTGNVKGIVEAQLNVNRFTGPAKQAGQSISELGQKGKLALNTLTTESRTATGALTNMGSQGGAAFQSLGTGAQSAGTEIRATATEINGANIATVGMVGSIAGLAASFVALETSISNIPKRLNAIKKAEVGLDRATNLAERKTLALEKAQLQLDKARQDSKKTVQDISILEQNLTIIRAETATALDDLAAKQEDLNLKHDDYADTLKLFSTSVATTFLTAGSSIFIMLSTMATAAEVTTGQFIKMKFATLAQSGALKTLGFNFAGAKAAMAGATFGLKGFTMGLRATMIALGPVGWAIIGVGAAWQIWENNMFGVQQRFDDLWKWLKQVMPVLQLLEGLVQTIFPEANTEVTDLTTTLDEASLATDHFGNNLEKLGTGLEDSLIPDLQNMNSELNKLGTEFDRAGRKADNFKKKRDSISILQGSGEAPSFEDSLFGATGIFSRSSNQVVGFRGEGIRVPVSGSAQAVAAAMERFGVSREVAQRLTQTSKLVRSRVFGSTRNSTGNQGASFTGATRGAGKRGGRGDRTVPNPDEMLVMSLSSGDAISQAYAEHIRDGVKLLPSGTGGSQTLRNMIGEQNKLNIANRIQTGDRLARDLRALEIIDPTYVFKPSDFRNATSLLASRRTELASLVSRSGLTQSQILEMEAEPNGETDVLNIIAFNERLLMEANSI